MKNISSIFLLLSSFFCQAQEIEMADRMRAEGKIYVVITVILIILIGVLTYLINIDRKITKLEKEAQKK